MHIYNNLALNLFRQCLILWGRPTDYWASAALSFQHFCATAALLLGAYVMLQCVHVKGQQVYKMYATERLSRPQHNCLKYIVCRPVLLIASISTPCKTFA